MKQLADFYQGDTKRWRVEFAADIAGSAIVFRMAKSFSQPVADLEIAAVMDSPDVGGVVLGGTLEITAAAGGALEAGEYQAEHKITTVGGDVTTFMTQKIRLLPGVPKG